MSQRTVQGASAEGSSASKCRDLLGRLRALRAQLERNPPPQAKDTPIARLADHTRGGTPHVAASIKAQSHTTGTHSSTRDTHPHSGDAHSQSATQCAAVCCGQTSPLFPPERDIDKVHKNVALRLPSPIPLDCDTPTKVGEGAALQPLSTHTATTTLEVTTSLQTHTPLRLLDGINPERTILSDYRPDHPSGFDSRCKTIPAVEGEDARGKRLGRAEGDRDSPEAGKDTFEDSQISYGPQRHVPQEGMPGELPSIQTNSRQRPSGRYSSSRQVSGQQSAEHLPFNEETWQERMSPLIYRSTRQDKPDGDPGAVSNRVGDRLGDRVTDRVSASDRVSMSERVNVSECMAPQLSVSGYSRIDSGLSHEAEADRTLVLQWERERSKERVRGSQRDMRREDRNEGGGSEEGRARMGSARESGRESERESVRESAVDLQSRQRSSSRQTLTPQAPSQSAVSQLRNLFGSQPNFQRSSAPAGDRLCLTSRPGSIAVTKREGGNESDFCQYQDRSADRYGSGCGDRRELGSECYDSAGRNYLKSMRTRTIVRHMDTTIPPQRSTSSDHLCGGNAGQGGIRRGGEADGRDGLEKTETKRRQWPPELPRRNAILTKDALRSHNAQEARAERARHDDALHRRQQMQRQTAYREAQEQHRQVEIERQRTRTAEQQQRQQQAEQQAEQEEVEAQHRLEECYERGYERGERAAIGQQKQCSRNQSPNNFRQNSPFDTQCRTSDLAKALPPLAPTGARSSSQPGVGSSQHCQARSKEQDQERNAGRRSDARSKTTSGQERNTPMGSPRRLLLRLPQRSAEGAHSYDDGMFATPLSSRRPETYRWKSGGSGFGSIVASGFASNAGSLAGSLAGSHPASFCASALNAGASADAIPRSVYSESNSRRGLYRQLETAEDNSRDANLRRDLEREERYRYGAVRENNKSRDAFRAESRAESREENVSHFLKQFISKQKSSLEGAVHRNLARCRSPEEMAFERAFSQGTWTGKKNRHLSGDDALSPRSRGVVDHWTEKERAADLGRNVTVSRFQRREESGSNHAIRPLSEQHGSRRSLDLDRLTTPSPSASLTQNEHAQTNARKVSFTDGNSNGNIERSDNLKSNADRDPSTMNTNMNSNAVTDLGSVSLGLVPHRKGGATPSTASTQDLTSMSPEARTPPQPPPHVFEGFTGLKTRSETRSEVYKGDSTHEQRTEREEEERGRMKGEEESKSGLEESVGTDRGLGSRLGPRDFIFLRVLGKGSYGTVMLVQSQRDRKFYAMKMLRKDKIVERQQVQHTRFERRILGSLKHPFIVQLYWAFQTPKKLYFVMEYCPGGELFFHLSRASRFNEAKVRFYAAEVILALEFLHDLDVVYRDLKPENVLLDASGHIRITDFGLSKGGINSNLATRSLCGTPEYLAPEILSQSGHGKPVDWWSLGALVYEMLTGLPPFYSKNRERLFDNIRHADLRYPSSCISPVAKDLLQKLLRRDPNARLGGGERDAAEIKEHPFFADVNWQAFLERKVQPPFVPSLHSDHDVRYFDREFLKLPVVDSEACEDTDKNHPAVPHSHTYTHAHNHPQAQSQSQPHTQSRSQSQSQSKMREERHLQGPGHSGKNGAERGEDMRVFAASGASGVSEGMTFAAQASAAGLLPFGSQPGSSTPHQVDRNALKDYHQNPSQNNIHSRIKPSDAQHSSQARSQERSQDKHTWRPDRTDDEEEENLFPGFTYDPYNVRKKDRPCALY